MVGVPEIIRDIADVRAWRRDIHAHPELAFCENRTASIVAEKLSSWGLTVARGIGGVGLVGTLKAGVSSRSIGLRADMDALPIAELNKFEHRSTSPGIMHACGHDGHTAMLLGAARYLAATKKFDGTVQFIFQPAEEANSRGSGAKAMIADRLFERFPVDSVFAIHNAPGFAEGKFNVCIGPALASMDLFEILVSGKGTHGAAPQFGVDTILASAHILTAVHSIVSRNVDPLQSSVLSVTSLHSGEGYNAIPETAEIKGSIRTHSNEVRALILSRMSDIVAQCGAAMGADAKFSSRLEYTALINDKNEAGFAAQVASEVVGKQLVQTGNDALPVMGSDDFAFMLEERPGAYVQLGAGEGADCAMLHEPRYDFNDALLPIGASYFARLVETKLASIN